MGNTSRAVAAAAWPWPAHAPPPATPIPTQVDALCPSLLGSSKQEFAFRYCDGRLVPRRNPAQFWRGGAGGNGQPGHGGGGGGEAGPPQPPKRRLDTSGERKTVVLGLAARAIMQPA